MNLKFDLCNFVFVIDIGISPLVLYFLIQITETAQSDYIYIEILGCFVFYLWERCSNDTLKEHCGLHKF